MTIETLKIGNTLASQIEQTQVEISQMNALLNQIREERVVARVGGISLRIPKAAFRNEVQSRKAELQTQLTTLQNKFDAL